MLKALLIMVILGSNGNVEIVTHTVQNMETCAVVRATIERSLDGASWVKVVNTSCIPTR